MSGLLCWFPFDCSGVANIEARECVTSKQTASSTSDTSYKTKNQVCANGRCSGNARYDQCSHLIGGLRVSWTAVPRLRSPGHKEQQKSTSCHQTSLKNVTMGGDTCFHLTDVSFETCQHLTHFFEARWTRKRDLKKKNTTNTTRKWSLDLQVGFVQWLSSLDMTTEPSFTCRSSCLTP